MCVRACVCNIYTHTYLHAGKIKDFFPASPKCSLDRLRCLRLKGGNLTVTYLKFIIHRSGFLPCDLK